MTTTAIEMTGTGTGLEVTSVGMTDSGTSPAWARTPHPYEFDIVSKAKYTTHESQESSDTP
jgi:hypothetical protein